ncbi:unnamed protein product, partial [Polarella glacialis]
VRIIANKIDLLPRDASVIRVRGWVAQEAILAGFPRVKITDVFPVSCHDGKGIMAVAKLLDQQNTYREHYLVGAANVGKSSLINRLSLRKRKGVGETSAKDSTGFTVSLMPGTTLRPLVMKYQQGNTKLIDMPGLLVPGSFTERLTLEDLQQIIPQKRGALRVTFRMAEGRSILMGALARIDMAEGRPYQFTVFASEKLKIHECAIDKADWIAQRWAGGKLTPPMKAEQFAPMQPWVLHRFELTGRGWDEACVDLVVHGLGWVALTGVGDFVVAALSSASAAASKERQEQVRSLSALGRSSSWAEALLLLERLLPRWLGTDGGYGAVGSAKVACNAVISACGRGRQWAAGLRLLWQMLTCGPEPDCISFNSAMDCCAAGDSGAWIWSLALLGSVMPSAGLQPDGFSYASAIRARSKDSEWAQSVRLLASMKASGVRVGIVACSVAALTIEQQMHAAGLEVDLITRNSLTSAFEKGRQWQRAFLLCFEEARFNGLEPDAVTHNAAVTSCVKGQEWAKALGAYQVMRVRGVSPTQVTAGAVTSAFAEGSCWADALQMLDGPVTAFRFAGLVACNAAMNALEKGRQWQQVLKLLDNMRDAALEPDQFCYNAAMSSFEKGQQWEMALWLLVDMKGRK